MSYLLRRLDTEKQYVYAVCLERERVNLDQLSYYPASTSFRHGSYTLLQSALYGYQAHTLGELAFINSEASWTVALPAVLIQGVADNER